jgi:hypothetical protein
MPAGRPAPPFVTAGLFDSLTKPPDNTRFRSEGFPSGQRGQTVNLLAQPSKVRILPPPPIYRGLSQAWQAASLIQAAVVQG